ncbi:MAG: cytochrome c [Phyllobacteriaceae bacterium]|nr:cytochrome c [Phyllobacteriaceae bacterium]
MKPWVWLGAGGIAVAVLVTVAAIRLTGGGADPGGTELLRPDHAPTLALGEQLYQANCASCHGVDLEGEVADWRSPKPDGLLPAPPHDETGHTWHHPDQVLFAITKLGVARAANLENYVSAMPAYQGVLTDDEIIAILSYIKSTWPEDVRKRHDELNRISAKEPRS